MPGHVRRDHIALKAGLEAMGLKFLVKEQYQIPQMNAICMSRRRQ